jgi:glycosyltransferase involved in cell wall biosynthesis
MTDEVIAVSFADTTGLHVMSLSARVPAVSVVVPCYNGGRYLDPLLDGLKRQTLQDFEVVIVDDGSTDIETKAKLASLDPSVRVFRQENGGPGAARNTGIRQARAELILAIDCDDSIEPTFLAETVAAIEAAGPRCGFAFSQERKIGYREGIHLSYFKLFDQLFINRVPSCMLMRKQAWQDVGGYDESFREGYEDWEITVALGRAGYSGIVVPKVLFIYLNRQDGLMMSRSTHMHGVLWARIRRKHQELYRLPRLLKLWWRDRTVPGQLSLPFALAVLAMVTFLPDAWFTALTHWQRLRRQALPTEQPSKA